MKGFADDLVTLIGRKEANRLDNVMYDVAQKIQGDVIAVTYRVIDAFYRDYTHDDGRIYIRTDEYKHPHGKNGKFRPKNRSEWTRGSDVSLQTALKSMDDGHPSIGICRPLDNMIGYQAGVVFDEERVAKKMKHRVMGSHFTEWNIVEDFLVGAHGDESIYTTTPSADLVLSNYINSYKPRFDKHYKNALKKFNK